MRCRGDQLVMDDQYAVDSIRPKCVELQRMCEQYKDLLRRRHQMLARSHDLHDRLDRANRWCSAGADLLASRPLEQCKTTQGAAEALADFDTYLQTSRDLRLSNPRELRNVFDDVMTAETKGNVQQVLKQMDDVYAMCEKRRASLHKMGGPHGQPLSPPTHIPHRRFSSHHPHDEMDGSAEHRRRCSREESMRKVQGYQDKPTRLRPVDTGVGHSSASSGHDSSSSGISSKTSSIAASDTSSSDLPMTSDSAQRGSLSSVSLSSLPEIDVLQAKRRHVMNELIETEQAYVTELQEILWGYLKEMDSRAMQHIIPEELIGQKHVLFGNLEQICKFHAETFLEELQDCRDYPAKVGRCFVNRREEFQMYSIYCQNKPKSEALRMRVGDLNPFFKECQHKLGHKLPLGAYLLKPVQRITKYQLLLKEMLRFTGDDKDLERQLQDALDTMLSVLQYLNASMHQVHIVGYQENLLDLGRLLMHGGFSVWTEHKRERIKDLRFKAMQRHIFLYERGLLLCKKKEESNDDPVYVFKNKLKLSQVGLTEKLRGDKRRFELWSRGREEVFIIQAANLQVKDVWVKEIKRVLMNQFDQIRSHHKMYVPMTQEEPSSTFSSTQLSSDSSDYSLDNWRGGGGGGGGNGGGGYSSAATTSSAAPLPPPPPSSSSSSSSSAVTTTIPSATTSTTIMTSTTSTPAYNIINNNHTSTLPMGLEMISPLTPPSNTSFTTHCLPHTQPHLHHRHPADRGRRMEEESWSSGELSNEETGQETARSYEPSYRQQFVSLSDYEAVDSTELGMGDGDVVEVLRVGGHGWWYARLVSTGAEGWVPSTFLDPVPVPQQSINSSSDSLSTPGKREMSLSRSSLGSPYYLSSPVSETTV